MRTLLLLLLLPFLSVGSISAQTSKAEKAEQLAKLFRETRTLVESNQFKITIDRVFPQSGMNVDRFNPRGEMTINDSIAQGKLPYFGRAYSLPYGESGGIEFDGPMTEKSVKIVEKKNKKMITYRFAIRGKNDTYQLTIDIFPGGNCSINVNSNNRNHISYSGNVSPLEEE